MHANKISQTRLDLERCILLLILIISMALLAGCGKQARQARTEHIRQQTAVNSYDHKDVLAGRDAKEVLLQTMERAGCTWLEKGVIVPAESRTVVTGFSYDDKANQLIIHQYSEYEWGLGKIQRANSDAFIPVTDLKLLIDAPNPQSSFQCWAVDITCLNGECVRVNSHSQLMRDGTPIEDRGRKQYRTKYWYINFGNRQNALDVWAALKTLSEQD